MDMHAAAASLQIRQRSIWVFFMMLLFVQPAYSAADDFTDAIDWVKARPTSKIEAGRTDIPFEQWVRNLAGNGAEINWMVEECDSCVSVEAELPDGRNFFAKLWVAQSADIERGMHPGETSAYWIGVGYKKVNLFDIDGRTSAKEPPPILIKLEEFMKIDLRSLILLYAAKQGDLELTKDVLKQGADVHSIYGGLALIEAVVNGKLSLIQMLVDAGADVNARSPFNNNTPLSVAARYGNATGEAIVKLLLASGVDKNSISEALVDALSPGNLEVIRLLLKAGANVNQKKYGDPPLVYAAGADRENAEVVRILLDAGADANYGEAEGTGTPLWWAASKNHLEIMQLLLKSGANVNAMSLHATALNAAAEHGGVSSMQLLIDHGAKIDLKDAESPLFDAIRSGSMENVQFLLDHGADINAVFFEYQFLGYPEGCTPLMAAVLNANLKMVELLVKKGADLNRRDMEGDTALMIAIKEHHPKIAKLLRRAGAKQ